MNLLSLIMTHFENTHIMCPVFCSCEESWCSGNINKPTSGRKDLGT